jgi:hypothetical protein
VVAADRNGQIVVVATNISPSTAVTVIGSPLVRWHSADRGQTWDGPTPFQDWPTGADFAGDPWLVTDHRGRFHLIHLAINFKNPKVCPCVYRRSVDDGATWEDPVRIADVIDRPVIAVSPNGERLSIIGMMNDPDAAPLTDADLVNGNTTLAATNRVMTAGVFRSKDRGKSWKRLAGPPGIRSAVAFSTVIDDAGRIAAGWVVNDGKGSHSVVGTTADDGATWSLTTLVEALQPDRNHPFSYGRFPVVAVDGSGILHVVFVEAGGKAVSTRLSRDWTTWSATIRLSADPVAGVRFPAIGAAGNVIHAMWMEKTTGERYQMRYRASKDGGANWTETLTLSCPNPASPLVTEQGFLIISDDDQSAIIDNHNGIAHAVWAVRGEKGDGYAVWHTTVEFLTPKK